MSEFKNKMITTKGMELLSKALSGEKLEFIRIEMGSGEFVGDLGVAEGLVQVKQNLPITKITRKGSQVTLSAALKVEDITSEYDWTEIGVYARGKDGVEILYMYGHTQNSSFISKDSLNEKLINVTVLVSNVTEVTAVIEDSLVYLTAEALKEHESSNVTHQDIREAIEAVRVQLGDLDISWEGITGKPIEFPVSPHKHSKDEIDNFPTSLPASGGNADTVGGRSFIWQGQSGQPQWIWGANEPGNKCYVWNPATLNVNSSTYVQGRNLCSEVDSLKQSVVNGKQDVVNAINDKLGYNSGLTTNHTHGDYAWHIRNSLGKSADSVIRNVAYQFALKNSMNRLSNAMTNGQTTDFGIMYGRWVGSGSYMDLVIPESERNFNVFYVVTAYACRVESNGYTVEKIPTGSQNGLYKITRPNYGVCNIKIYCNDSSSYSPLAVVFLTSAFS